MSQLPKHIQDALQSQSTAPLTASEKAKMRMNLSSFIEQNPVKASRFEFLTRRLFHLRPVFAGLTVVFLFSGVSLASAQTALPGDSLYDLKLLVNEEVPMLFMDEQEKQDFVVKQMDNRLEEAEQLKEKGELTPKQQEVLQGKFDEYFDKIADNERPGKIHKDLTSVLEQHQDVLPEFTVTAEATEGSTADDSDTEKPQNFGKGKPFKNKNHLTLKEFFELTHKPMEELTPVEEVEIEIEIEEGQESEPVESSEGEEIDSEESTDQETVEDFEDEATENAEDQTEDEESDSALETEDDEEDENEEEVDEEDGPSLISPFQGLFN